MEDEGQKPPEATAPIPETQEARADTTEPQLEPIDETRQLIQEIKGNVKRVQDRLGRLGRDDFK